VLYSNHRIDEDKLDPIFERYRSQFRITYRGPLYHEDELRVCGFIPEEVGEENWRWLLEADGELITISAKK